MFIFVLVIAKLVDQERFLRFFMDDVVIVVEIVIPFVIVIVSQFPVTRMVFVEGVIDEFIAFVVVFTHESVFQNFPLFAATDLPFRVAYDIVPVVNAPVTQEYPSLTFP